MNFNVDDIVYIRYHADDEKEIYSERFGIDWWFEMDDFEGHVGIVTQIDSIHNSNQYLVNYDGEELWFDINSLEPYTPSIAIGTKVLVRHHSDQEKQQYHSQYSLFWEKSMDTFEGTVGTIQNCDICNDHNVYIVEDDTGHCWWFAESSFIPLEYDIF